MLTTTPTRKRNRSQCEREEEHESSLNMDLDEQFTLLDFKSVNELNSEELKIAQSIAIDKLQKVLFLDIDAEDIVSKTESPRLLGLGMRSPSPAYSEDESSMDTMEREHPLTSFVTLPSLTSASACLAIGDKTFNRSASAFRPPHLKPPRGPLINTLATESVTDLASLIRRDSIMASNNLRVPTFLHYTCRYLLTLKDLPDGLFQRQGDPGKMTSIKLMMSKQGMDTVIENMQEKDIVDLGCLLIQFLQSIQALLPVNTHPIFKGILALNQATGMAPRFSGSAVRSPTEATKKLLRDALLLIALPHRQVLQYLIGFCCRVARPTSSKSRYASVRTIATIFGPFLYSSAKKPSEWMSCLFELLMYSNGLSQTDTMMEESTGLLWKLNHSFATEIKDRLLVTRTPSKKQVGLTPRRVRTRVLPKGSKGATPRRLFTDMSPLKPPAGSPLKNQNATALNFVTTSNGKTFLDPFHESSTDRQAHSKRLRVE